MNPRHEVLEAMYRAKKAHGYADFKPFLTLQNIIDDILVILIVLEKNFGENRVRVML